MAAKIKFWCPKNKVLLVLNKGTVSRTDLLRRTKLKAAELNSVLEELTRDRMVRVIKKETGHQGAPTTWIELVRR